MSNNKLIPPPGCMTIMQFAEAAKIPRTKAYECVILGMVDTVGVGRRRCPTARSVQAFIAGYPRGYVELDALIAEFPDQVQDIARNRALSGSHGYARMRVGDRLFFHEDYIDSLRHESFEIACEEREKAEAQSRWGEALGRQYMSLLRDAGELDDDGYERLHPRNPELVAAIHRWHGEQTPENQTPPPQIPAD